MVHTQVAEETEHHPRISIGDKRTAGDVMWNSPRAPRLNAIVLKVISLKPPQQRPGQALLLLQPRDLFIACAYVHL